MLEQMFKILDDSNEFKELLNSDFDISFIKVMKTFFESVIHPLLTVQKSSNWDVPNRLRYFWFQTTFEPKTKTEVLRYYKTIDKNNRVVLSRRNANINPKIEGEQILSNYDFFSKLKSKKLGYYYASYDLFAPKNPLMSNPFFRWYFIFEPTYKGEKKLTGDLFSDAYKIFNYFDDEIKLFNLFCRIMRLHATNEIEIKKRYLINKKNLNEDCKKLYFEMERKADTQADQKKKKRKNLLKIKKPAYFAEKKAFFDKWIKQKREEYFREVSFILAPEIEQ